MVSEREIGVILTEIKHLTEKLGAHTDQTQRLFTENSIENSRRFDKIDERMDTSDIKIDELAGSFREQKVINRIGTWGAATLVAAIGAGILWFLGIFPAIAHWVAGK